MSARGGSDDSFLDEVREFAGIDEILVDILNELKDISSLLSGADRTIKVDAGGKTVEIDASEDQVHRFDKEANLVNENIREVFTIPPESENITIHVEDAADSFEVSVIFTDDKRDEITRVDSDTDPDLSGDSNNDVFAEVDIASPFITIKIDHTGTEDSNEVDYTLLAR